MGTEVGGLLSTSTAASDIDLDTGLGSVSLRLTGVETGYTTNCGVGSVTISFTSLF